LYARTSPLTLSSPAKFRAKVEAGGIIPAVATSTSVASAFTCMDVFRVALHKRSPGSVSFPGRCMDLGYMNTPFCTFQPSPPLAAKVSSAYGEFQVRLATPSFSSTHAELTSSAVDGMDVAPCSAELADAAAAG
jgi:hypothetical protein